MKVALHAPRLDGGQGARRSQVVRTADGLMGTLADLQSPVCPMTHHTHEAKIGPRCRRSGSRPGAERRLT